MDMIEKNPKNILISGDSLSGKSSCIKYLIMNLSNSFTTIFIDGNGDIQLPIKSHIERMKKKCYNRIPDNETTIVFIDNFHQIKNSDKRNKILEFFNKEKNIYLIITTDKLYNLQIIKNSIFDTSYEILPLGYALEDKLINNWLEIVDFTKEDFNQKRIYYSSLINNIFLKYTMPRYPFFFYTILYSLFNNTKGLSVNITSEYYCYYFLISQCLLNANIELNQFDMYLNILSEISYLFFKRITSKNIKDKKLKEEMILDFLENDYKTRYNINENISIDKILSKLHNAKIFVYSDIREYHFAYPYIYYFFLGKYFSENLNDNMEDIKKMIDNLHILENSYIIMFLIYNTKNSDILEYLNSSILSYLKNEKIMTLKNEDVNHLDKYSEKISNIVLSNIDIEKNREDHFKRMDKFEEDYNLNTDMYEEPDTYDDNFLEIKKSIKSIELMGCIIKSRHASLLRDNIYRYFTNSVILSLKISNNLFGILQKEEKEFVNWIETKMLEEDIDNINNIKNIVDFIVYQIYYLISIFTIKISSQYLCSENLIYCINELKEEMPLPIIFLIEKDIKLNYKQNVDTSEIRKILSDKNISKYVKKIYIDLITSYCNINRINKKTLEEVEKIIGIYYAKK